MLRLEKNVVTIKIYDAIYNISKGRSIKVIKLKAESY